MTLMRVAESGAVSSIQNQNSGLNPTVWSVGLKGKTPRYETPEYSTKSMINNYFVVNSPTFALRKPNELQKKKFGIQGRLFDIFFNPLFRDIKNDKLQSCIVKLSKKTFSRLRFLKYFKNNYFQRRICTKPLSQKSRIKISN